MLSLGQCRWLWLICRVCGWSASPTGNFIENDWSVVLSVFWSVHLTNFFVNFFAISFFWLQEDSRSPEKGVGKEEVDMAEKQARKKFVRYKDGAVPSAFRTLWRLPRKPEQYVRFAERFLWIQRSWMSILILLKLESKDYRRALTEEVLKRYNDNTQVVVKGGYFIAHWLRLVTI